MIFPAIHSGTALVVPSRTYNPLKTLRAIAHEKCTFINGTPTMFVDLVELQTKMNLDVSSLEMCVVGGAPCPPSLVKDMSEVLNLKIVKVRPIVSHS